LFVEFFHWYATPSKALTTALVAVYSYISQQLFSFKSHKTNTDFIEE
jgi:putative flippase GtrA